MLLLIFNIIFVRNHRCLWIINHVATKEYKKFLRFFLNDGTYSLIDLSIKTNQSCVIVGS